MLKRAMTLGLVLTMMFSGMPRLNIIGDENEKEKKTDYVDGEVVIMYYDTGAKSKSVENRFDKLYAIEDTCVFENAAKNSGVSKKSSVKKDLKISLVKSEKLSTEELIADLKNDSDIVYAEPNYRVYENSFEADDYTKFQWPLDNRGQNGGMVGADINYDSEQIAIEANPDEEKVVALIDSGLDIDNKEFEGRIWENPFPTEVLPGKHGYDFYRKSDVIKDIKGHGTHCGGIIAASIKDNMGIVGVANDKNVKIMPIVSFSKNQYYIIEAYNYIYQAMQLGVNVVAVNNSWGIDHESDIFREIIELVGQKGALSVCAAGNDSSDNESYHHYPSDFDSDYIISVAASDSNDEPAYFTNYGAESVDIAAPGQNVLSTVSYNNFCPELYNNVQIENLTSIYYSYDEGNPVQIIDENGYIVSRDELKKGDIPYGLKTTDTVSIDVGLDNDNTFGYKEENKSLAFKFENTKASEDNYIYFPFTVGESEEDIFSSFNFKVRTEGVNDYVDVDIYITEIDESGIILKKNCDYVCGYRCDEKRKDTWINIKEKILYESTENKNMALVLELTTSDDTDCEIYIDSFGISKENVDETEFGKYDWMSGTSMAAPHVAGAVAVLASVYPDKTPLELKKILLGSVRKNDSWKGKLVSEGILDLSNIAKKQMYIESIDINNDNQLVIKGMNLTGAKIICNKKELNPASSSDSLVIVKGCSGYINIRLEIEAVKGNEKVSKTKIITKGKPYDYSYTNYDDDDCPYHEDVYSDGEKLFSYYNGNIYFGSVPNDPKDMITWYCMRERENLEQLGLTKEEIENSNLNIVRDKYTCYSNNVIFARPIDSEGKRLLLYGYNYVDGVYFKIGELNSTFDDEDYRNIKVFVYDGSIYCVDFINKQEWKVEGDVKAENADTKLVLSDDLNLQSFPDDYNPGLGRVYQIDERLIFEMKDEANGSLKSNMYHCIFENGEWKKSCAKLEPLAEDTYQCVPVKEGLMYLGARVKGLGDTFIYDVETDSYKSTGYKLGYDEISGKYAVGSGFGVKDRVYFMGECYSATIYKYINVEPAFVKVEVPEVIGASVYGPGYYAPGDLVTLRFQLSTGLSLKYEPIKLIINGVEQKYDRGRKCYEYKGVARELAKGIDIKTEAPVKVNIEGFQISPLSEGHRAVYTVDKGNATVVQTGMIYGLEDECKDSEMSVGSSNECVHSFASTEQGKVAFEKNSDKVQAYAMTMKFINNREYYKTGLKMRAYAKLSSGQIFYSPVVETSVYNIADYMYQNNIMTSEENHDYLFNKILHFCDSDYAKIEYSNTK